MDEGLLEDEFLIKWNNGELNEFFEKHILYKKEIMNDLIKKSQKLIQWLQEPSEESGSESDDN